MKKTTTIKLHAKRILELKLLEDGTYDVLLEVEEEEKESESATNDTKPVFSESDFVLIEAESLSMDDEFMQYVPKNEEEEETKKLIMESIKIRICNFYKPRSNIAYAVEYPGSLECIKNKKRVRYTSSYNMAERAALKFMPEHNSRIGLKCEYGAYLGVLIKKLIEEGETVEWAWNTVVNKPGEILNHYIKENSIVDTEKPRVADIYGFYDSDEIGKTLSWDENSDGFWATGVKRPSGTGRLRITEFRLIKKRTYGVHSIPWLVLS